MRFGKSFLSVATAATLGAAISLPTADADATLIMGTFEGTVDFGIDTGWNFFGTPGGDLTGQSLTGTFTYDTALAPAPLSPGQLMSSGTDNWLTGSITIDGVTWSFDLGDDPATSNDLSVGVTDEPDSFTANITRSLVTTDLIGSEALGLLLPEGMSDFITGLGLPESLSWTFDGNNPGTGNFSVSIGCLGAPGCTDQSFFGSFSPSRVTIQPAAVSEPGTLGLMVLGLAGVSVARMRSRRTQRPS